MVRSHREINSRKRSLRTICSTGPGTWFRVFDFGVRANLTEMNSESKQRWYPGYPGTRGYSGT
eukprot:3152302-Rhodomonas_salina.2